MTGVLPFAEASRASDCYSPTMLIQPTQKTARLISGVRLHDKINLRGVKMAEVTTLSFDYSIPDLLAGKIDVSDPYQNYNSRGNPTSFGVDLDFHEMHLSKTIKSSEFYVLRGKIEDTLRTWETKFQRHLVNGGRATGTI